jgi:hypothetical protein
VVSASSSSTTRMRALMVSPSPFAWASSDYSASGVLFD